MCACFKIIYYIYIVQSSAYKLTDKINIITAGILHPWYAFPMMKGCLISREGMK